MTGYTKFEYVLSLSIFTIQEMIGLHLSNDIKYENLEQFPMVKKNIKWLIHQSIVDRNLNLSDYKWHNILNSYWNKAHFAFEKKKKQYLVNLLI